ncbi:MAG: hypothetical protein EOO50_06125 [Flavobacterium sp.]|uniref:hypothetical protein n=1 Tax=Flavobacterium sp. TaxID=239 RepID=UPI001208961A|nr:hypothetical protein [Flavobacterium sp.]RZJ67319.1 MAG: hypothetical protein EOO50_06125 [Flavobacterium sp.]
MNTPDKDRKVDDPKLNQDASTYDKDETFEDSDDFHKYDDTDHSNVTQEDPIAKSNESTNDNSKTATPTFTRTYDKNASDVENSGKDDGNIGI